LGATPDVVEAVITRALREHPSLRVCGWRDGYWQASDTQPLVERVRASHPDILFVAMPSPRKEFWLAEHLDELQVPFSMGVGGSFDVYAGLVKRAPLWMQRAGLEWLYRLAQEPERLWRRYLLGNLQFILLVTKCRLARVTAGGIRRASSGGSGGP
jgi:N-acetylglucosaminyldiphosphoundecaprenol N-acetyl-beta-D-mannosaminyltransferase